MRYPSIDILRAMAIALMVHVHFVENLSGTGYWVPSGFAAPLFTFLSGVSYRLWLRRQWKRGKEGSEISKVSLRRGLFLFGVGIAFNVLVWLPEDTFNWDILTFIGSSLMLLNLVRVAPPPVSALFCVLAFAISPALRASTEYASYWENNYFDYDWTLSDVVLGFLVNGYFPIFPWIIYPVAGYLVAERLFSPIPPPAGEWNRLLALGACLAASAALALCLRPYGSAWMQAHLLTRWTMFPASPVYVLGTLGAAILGFVGLHRWLDPHPYFQQERLLTRIASTFSANSFTLYLLHHVAHVWPLWVYGNLYGTETTEFWMQAMPYAWSCTLAIVFLVAIYFVLRLMKRTGVPSIETLMRWICD